MLKEGMFVQGRYEIVGKIGTGGMADVYKARDHKLNRFVAVKVLKTEFRGDKAFITKFRAEAQAAAGLAHPNIVNIYDVGEDRGINFIVMELVEGITLKEYIAKKGKLAVREATSIAIAVSQGLEAAHNSGIIHRDVKPQNIIISTDGKVKVTDFGIARATTSNTISTAVMGSVHYSSPEQARGGYSDAKSDIYSLGITMYEMLTGQVPFDGDTTVSIAIKHLQEEMKSPEVYVPNLPKSTVQIIYKCTQKSPDRRYATMAELIYDLKESLVNPDGDFVRINNVNNGGRTVVISKEELGAIKESYLNRSTVVPENGDQRNAGAAGVYNTGGQELNYGGIRTPQGMENEREAYDPYTFGRAYGNRGYDYQEEMNEMETDIPDDEEDDGILSPRLEKIMTVGSIIIAILIACIFLGLIANALGIVKFSLPDLFGSTSSAPVKQTEERENGAETNSLAQSDGSAMQETQAPAVQETQPTTPETQEPTESPTEPVTESPTETETENGPTQILDEVPIPEVAGMYFAEAQDAMMSAGFYVERQDENTADYPADVVIDQSATGSARPGSSIILRVSTGIPEPDTAGTADGTASAQGKWECNVQLDPTPDYHGETAQLVLVQGNTSKVILEGVPITLPYNLNTTGEPGVATGDVYLYVWDEATGQYKAIVSYPDVPFERVS